MMNKDRLQSTKMYDEILDQNSDLFFNIFFSEGINPILMNLAEQKLMTLLQ